MQANTDYPDMLPDCSSVNLCDGNEAEAYSHLALALLQMSAYCGDGRPGYRLSGGILVSRTRQWIGRIEDNAPRIPPAQLVRALGGFDLMYRYVYGVPASSGFLNRCYLRAFDEGRTGDAKIGDEELFRAVAGRIRLRDSAFFGAPLRWYSEMLDSWYNTFRLTGSLPGATLPVALLQACFLLREDLFAFAGRRQDSFKKKLAVRYVPEVADGAVTGDDGDTLRAKLEFLRGNRGRFASFGRTEDMEQELLSALSDCPDIIPMHRKAFALDAELGRMIA